MYVQDARTWLQELSAQKLALYAQVSNELVEDGMDAGRAIEAAMAGSLAFGLDSAFISGNGVGMPRGILADDALITVAKLQGQAAATVLYENLTAMAARMHPALFGESVWLANVSTIPQLAQLQLSVGTGGAPVLTQRPDGSFSILTRPVIFTEKVPTLGTKGDVLLVALSQYGIGLRRGLSFAVSSHVGFRSDETAYRLLVRVDGRGRWSGPMTPLNGDTLSWCVALEDRS